MRVGFSNSESEKKFSDFQDTKKKFSEFSNSDKNKSGQGSPRQSQKSSNGSPDTVKWKNNIDLKQVQCYSCQSYGHLARNCKIGLPMSPV